MKAKTKLLSALLALVVAGGALTAILIFQKQAAPYDLTEKTNIAMDTIVGVKLYGAPSGSEAEASMNVVTGLEGVISRYKEGSDVYRLNKTGKCKSTLLPVVLTQCKAIEEASNGKFDLSVGAVSALWNFDAETPRLPDDAALQTAKATVDYRKITVTGDTVTLGEGQQLDLGTSCPPASRARWSPWAAASSPTGKRATNRSRGPSRSAIRARRTHFWVISA